jgi:hypothetical protein
MESAPDETRAAEAKTQFEFLKYVVEQEDYATGLKQQRALESGGKDYVLFGKNEGGGHHFHHWVDLLLRTEDKDLKALFETHQKTFFTAH